MLKKLKIKNFKSFKDFEIEFDKFNCIIAPNNAGKSNLVEAFRFLKYAIDDVRKAIEEFGGFDNVKNIFLDSDSIEFESEFFAESQMRSGFRNKYIDDVIKGKKDKPQSEEYLEVFKNLDIKINLKIFKDGNWEKNYYIKGKFGKKTNLDYDVFKERKKVFEDVKKLRAYSFELDVSYYTDFENKEYEHLLKVRNEIIRCELKKIKAKNEEDLLYALNLQNLLDKGYKIFSGSSDLLNLDNYFYAYSFYPEIIKTNIKGGNFLRFDGTNLVEVLKFLKNSFPQFYENISISLIGIVEELKEVKIDKDLMDRNILLLKEKDKYLPFNIVSDGTINLLALMTAINEPIVKNMIIFDEIEKHLHLRAIDYILEVLKSQNFQVAFTTQSSEIMNNLDLKKDNLIFLYRDYDGFTKAINAKKIPNFRKIVRMYKDVSTLIKNEVLGYLGDFDEN